MIKDDYYTYWTQPSYKESMSKEEADKSRYILSKIIHTDCWNYIKNKYNKELKYSDLKMIEYDNYTMNMKNMIFDNIKKDKMLLFPPLNIDYGEIKYYWSNDHGFLMDNIIKDNKEYLLYSPLSQEKKLSRYINKKESKKESKKKYKLIGNGIKNNEEKKLSDIKKNLERIDYIYKQIINL
jgi:hypothetical protein